jgi:hypothetical protein
MSQRNPIELDQVINEIRNQQVDETVVRDAAKRVFSRLFVESLPPPAERIRSCEDFQTLIPAYLNNTLPSARALLLEDHTRSCVNCRHALQEAQTGKPRLSAWLPVKRKSRVPLLAWATAACLAVGIAIGVTGAVKGVLPGQHAVRATVLSVEGSLYRISAVGSSLITVGSIITNGEDLRTAKGAHAILRLMNGAEVELAERSDVSISGGWRGTTVNVERGHIILETAERNPKSVYVAADDVLIPITNAVLSVNHGTKGSRVAVARGAAEVRQGQKTFQLKAGQQVSTDERLAVVPIANEFSWSKNASSYLALLGELSTLQKQFQSIASPDLRYSSHLVKYLPENTVLYAAIPNVGDTIVQAKRMFDERLAQSDILRDWWKQQPASRGPEFDRVLAQITTISHYLGDEIVLAVSGEGPHRYSDPVFLAEIRQAGLREYLQQNIPTTAGFQIVDAPSTLPATTDHRILVSFKNNVLIASTNEKQLQRVSQIIENPALGQFVQSPFYSRIAKSYEGGAGYLLSIDMEQIVPKSVDNLSERVPTGLNNVQYLVLERRDVTGRTETRASLSFAGSRQGISSWLAAPGTMGSLDFISPEASFATSFVVKNPRTLMTELLGFAATSDSGFAQHLSEFESHAGLSLIDDVAAPLGSDVTFAIDGPLLPIPAWKIALEVDDPGRFQKTLATFVDQFNQQNSSTAGTLHLTTDQVNSRTFYILQTDKMRNLAVYYTFINGYLLAGSNEANVLQAIQDQQTGHTLRSSPAFRSQLPDDSHTNFSGILYNNFGTTLGPLAGQLTALGSLTPEQQKSLSTFVNNTGPALICVYGEPDRIVVATRSTFLGFNLATLSGLQQGKPVLPLLAAGAMAAKSQPQRR